MKSAKRPLGLGPVSAAALDVLERYTMFPWPLLKTQAERMLLDPINLDADALALLMNELCDALASITSAEKAAVARKELSELLARLRMG